MGTETPFTTASTLNLSIKCAKLNNPLMGTETPFTTASTLNLSIKCAKLNNPLMGTETIDKNDL